MPQRGLERPSARRARARRRPCRRAPRGTPSGAPPAPSRGDHKSHPVLRTRIHVPRGVPHVYPMGPNGPPTEARVPSSLGRSLSRRPAGRRGRSRERGLSSARAIEPLASRLRSLASRLAADVVARSPGGGPSPQPAPRRASGDPRPEDSRGRQVSSVRSRRSRRRSGPRCRSSRRRARSGPRGRRPAATRRRQRRQSCGSSRAPRGRRPSSRRGSRPGQQKGALM